MKKQTAMALAAVFAMSVAGTALAAPVNPFVDVPAKHWSYDSINQLAKAGVISGYGDGTYQGDKTLTRYEAATLVAKAMANADKLNPENKKALEALKTEFGAELNNLGVRVSNIESRLDNVKIKGDIRIRYRHEKVQTPGLDIPMLNEVVARSRVSFTGQISDQFSFTGRVENSSTMRNHAGDTGTTFNQAFVTAKVLGGTYIAGRQDVFLLDGLLVDNTASSNFKGLSVTYPINKGAVTAFYGNQNVTTPNYRADWSNPNPDNYSSTLAALQVTNKIGVVDVGAGYVAMGKFRDGLRDAKKFTAYELTAGTKVGPDFYFSAAYAKSNQDDQNKAQTYKLSYKTFNYANPGSYTAYVQYRNMQGLSTTNGSFDSLSTYDIANVGNFEPLGFKGYELGFQYAPWKNVEFKTWYSDGKNTTNLGGAEVKDKFFASYFRFWF